jgi:catechol 2,3-dioxygenase-like lactoylglutathione lyase family enzyme
MSTTQVSTKTANGRDAIRPAAMKLEVIGIPVANVERSKNFYASLGWRLDADFVVGEEFRVVQFTPPGSPCSIHFGTGLTSAAPGSAQVLYLVVSDIEAARSDLVRLGVDVSDVFHRVGPGKPPMGGRHPEGRSYSSFVSFKDPDGNAWLVQEVTSRLPCRVDSAVTTFASPDELVAALRRAAAAHGEHEKRTPDQKHDDWPEWYAEYIVREQAGKPLPT